MIRQLHLSFHLFVMPSHSIPHQKSPLSCTRKTNCQLNSGYLPLLGHVILDRNSAQSCYLKARITLSRVVVLMNNTFRPRIQAIRSASENAEALAIDEDDDDLCPVECVREFKTDEELFRILEKAKETNSLVVVDFYRTSCGSCKYIEQGFAKLCRGACDQEAAVIFLKHNVIDEYDEQSEVAERLRIKTVPLFHFYKNGVLLEAFPTRDKERILAAILKYTDSSQNT